MAKVFDKMASLSGFTPDDLSEFLALAAELPPAEVGAVLGYLLGRLNAEDAAAFVAVVRGQHPLRRVNLPAGRIAVNIVGTGGGPSTFNITTAVTFVVAAAGVTVIKTGSNAYRGKSGFADVAARLGTLKVAMPWERIESIAREVGIVFVPPAYHAPVLGRLAELLTPAVYRNVAGYLNKLGPLLSPIRVDHRFIGAHSTACLEMLAGACQYLGDVPTTLVAGADGLDEVSTMAPTHVCDLAIDGSRRDSVLDPADFGILAPRLEELAGLEVAAAAECCERLLDGQGTGAQNDIVALNAGLVLHEVGKTDSLEDGFRQALAILRAGTALQKLRALRERVWNHA
jgi:anthranilate phosphoribosyltransferase